MRYYVENDGQFTVEINFWKNTCDVWYETVKLNEVDKKTYELGKEKIVVTGTPFSGLYLYRGGKRVLFLCLMVRLRCLRFACLGVHDIRFLYRVCVGHGVVGIKLQNYAVR